MNHYDLFRRIFRLTAGDITRPRLLDYLKHYFIEPTTAHQDAVIQMCQVVYDRFRMAGAVQDLSDEQTNALRRSLELLAAQGSTDESTIEWGLLVCDEPPQEPDYWTIVEMSPLDHESAFVRLGATNKVELTGPWTVTFMDMVHESEDLRVEGDAGEFFLFKLKGVAITAIPLVDRPPQLA